MSDYEHKDKTTIAPDVLLTIVSLAALDVEGVAGVAPVPGGFDQLFRRGNNDGVQITIEDGVVYVELYLILKHDANVREVSRTVQKQVARSISETVGMEAGHVNIHIEDISYEAKA
jgi:uncharacterized alkaline shock family protein YloU